MVTENIIGYSTKSGHSFLQGVDPSTETYLEEKFSIADQAVIHEALDKAVDAFAIYKKWKPFQRADLLDTIAQNIMNLGDTLVKRASLETGLPEARITGERARTVGQLKMFANAVRTGKWEENFIDHAEPERQPLPKPDLRKQLIALGPVVVFTASNFPLAYSTAGGDVASALAVGCPVIVKAHESHPGTNALVAGAIVDACKQHHAPDGLFSTLYGYGPELGQALIKDPRVKAVGFTGSYRAGRAIMDSAATRPDPIPVYAEMGSLNPVVITASAMQARAQTIGDALGASMTMGTGQFCTKPGLMIIEENSKADDFISALEKKIESTAALPMLNTRIKSNFLKSLTDLSKETKVINYNAEPKIQVHPAIAMVSGDEFLLTHSLHDEVFGPFAVVIRCKNADQIKRVLSSLGGQLTGTIWSEPGDSQNESIIEALESISGRLIWNGVPTGVEVADSMMHGGPFPSTSHPFFGAVGIGALKRWTRPVAYQNFPMEYLPHNLK